MIENVKHLAAELNHSGLPEKTQLRILVDGRGPTDKASI
jgi:hypothetical protein